MATVIPYTLPSFSKKDEELEIARLTIQEREAILDDMYGRNTLTSEGHNVNRGRILNNNNYNNEQNHQEEQRQNEEEDDDDNSDISEELLDEFDAALDLIPENEKREYLNALLLMPQDVFERESDPVVFLRSDNYNANRAALRLVKYWELRWDVFHDQAYKPMTVTGAMKDIVKDMTVIPNFLRILPDDEHGRTVICMDRTNLRVTDYDESIFIKILWFVAHVALQRQSTQKKGIVFIVIHKISSSVCSRMSINTMKSITKSFEYLPWKVKCMHVCNNNSIQSSVFLPIWKFYMSPNLRQRTIDHSSVNKSSSIVLEELESYGLRRDALPITIGGAYNIQPEWINQCKQLSLDMLKEQSRKKRKRNEEEDNI